MANRYWVGGSGTWDSTSTANWSTSSGGSSGASRPGSADTVIFDNNSNVGTGSFTVTIGTGALCQNFTFGSGASALDGAMTLAGTGTLSVNGSLTFPSTNLSVTFSGTMTFAATGTITTNGVSFAGPLVFNGSAQTFTLGGAVTTTSTLTLTQGTLALSTYTLTGTTFSSSNSSTRTINFGSGAKIALTGTSGTIITTSTSTALTITGTSRVELTANPAAGTTRTIIGAVTGGTESNALNYYITAGSDTIALSNNSEYKTIDMTGTTNATFTIGSANDIYGDLIIPSGTTVTSSANTLTFNGTGTQTITTNGVTADFAMNFSGTGGTRRLGSALTLGSTRTLTFSDGTLNLNGYDLTAGLLSITSAADVLAFGTNKIFVTATSGTVVTLTNLSSFTYTGTPNIEVTGNGSTTRTLAGTATNDLETNVLSVKVTAGTDTITIQGSFLNLEFTSGFGGSIVAGNLRTIYGNFIISGGSTTINNDGTARSVSFGATSGTKTVNLQTGTTIDVTMTFNGTGGTWQITNSFNMGAAATSRNLTLTAGTLDLNGKTIAITGNINISGSTTRQINGPGTISTPNNGSTVVAGTTLTNFSAGGSAPPVFELIYSGSAGTRTIQLGSTGGSGGENRTVSIKVSAGTDTISIQNSSVVTDLDFTGFSGTYGNAQVSIFGNLILSGTMTLTAGTNAMTFGATSGTKTITTNGETLDFPITFNGAGGTWQLQDAFTHGSTRTLTLTAGTFDAYLYNVTLNIFSSSGSGTRSVKFGTGTWTISGSGTSWDCSTSTNMTTTQGSATISMTSASSKTFAGGGLTYPTLNQGGAGALTISGSNTFANITNTTQPVTVTFTSGTTQTFTNFSLSGTAGNLVTIGSTTTSAHTLSKSSGTVSVSYCTISYSTATGGATWLASVTNGNVDGGNNSGWNFAAIVASYAYIGFFSFFQ